MTQIELTVDIARELELAEAQAAVQCVEVAKAAHAAPDLAVESIAGGFAVYCGRDNPVTQGVGLGLQGPVSEEEFDRLEAFYFSREEAVRVETCPIADATLMNHYKQRGYHVSEFSNVMAKVPDSENFTLPPKLEIRAARRDEIELWAQTVSQGFADLQPVSPDIVAIMKLFAMVNGTECYLASIDGVVAGGATFAVRGEVAGLFGASTLPEFRKRGVQTALLKWRLQRAAQLNCRLAMSIALPGSISQRNMARVGFQTLYTRVKFEQPFRENGAKGS